MTLRRETIAGAVLLLQSVVLAILVTVNQRLLLPVTVSLDGAQPVIARIDIGLAAVVLMVVVGLARLIPVPAGATKHTLRFIEFSFTSSVTVFLVALLNGIDEIGTLVLIYAITSGASLFSLLQERFSLLQERFFLLQERSDIRRGHPLLALCFGAGIGIVPWGVIAFYQMGDGLIGSDPPLIVRVVTLVMLASAFAFFLSQWREQRRRDRGGDRRVGERMHVLLTVVSSSLFAWLIVGGFVLGSSE